MTSAKCSASPQAAWPLPVPASQQSVWRGTSAARSSKSAGG
ncbi:MAG TPA: hypothetical protein VMV60_12535 [Thermoanaerobaculia bacterium]|nr:hypothetical protein [Thermoanaerobaculia bacterium]